MPSAVTSNQRQTDTTTTQQTKPRTTPHATPCRPPRSIFALHVGARFGLTGVSFGSTATWHVSKESTRELDLANVIRCPGRWHPEDPALQGGPNPGRGGYIYDTGPGRRSCRKAPQ